MLDRFFTLIMVVMVLWMFAYIQTHQISHINRSRFLHIKYTVMKLLKELMRAVEMRSVNSKEKLYENVTSCFLGSSEFNVSVI